jgi:hypothetical protein
MLALVVVVLASLAAGAAAFAEIHEPEDEDAALAVHTVGGAPATTPAHHREPVRPSRPHTIDLYRHTGANDMSPTVRGMPNGSTFPTTRRTRSR